MNAPMVPLNDVVEILRSIPAELAVTLRILDVTATSAVDYFAPTDCMLVFAGGRREARILVPLVQDTKVEADADIFRRVAVMIRDDDG